MFFNILIQNKVHRNPTHMGAIHTCQSKSGSQNSGFSTFNIGKNSAGKLCTRLRQQVHCTISASTLLTSGVIPSLNPLMLAIAVSGFRSSNCGQIQQKDSHIIGGQYYPRSQGRRTGHASQVKFMTCSHKWREMFIFIAFLCFQLKLKSQASSFSLCTNNI